MSKLVCYFNFLDLIIDLKKVINLVKWGFKCRNKKIKLRILKLCIKIIKKLKVDKNVIKLVMKF